MSEPLNDNTRELAALLEDRDGWRFEAFDDEDPWLFGVDGEARLVITPEMEGFRMYRADQDRSSVIPLIDQVEAWLDGNEAEHAGLSPLGEEYKRAAEGMENQDPGV